MWRANSIKTEALLVQTSHGTGGREGGRRGGGDNELCFISSLCGVTVLHPVG